MTFVKIYAKTSFYKSLEIYISIKLLTQCVVIVNADNTRAVTMDRFYSAIPVVH